MSSYKGFERKLARLLRSTPIIKTIIKDAYILFMRLIYFNSKTSISKYNLESIYSSKESFFGYFDKNPGNGKGLILFHTSQFDTSKSPKQAEFIEVNLQNEETKEVLWSHKTKAFNWQQGARLQWITKTKFMFNDFDELRNMYISKLVSINDFSITEYDLPVQDAYRDEYFLSLNYRRLTTLRPDYGYFCMPSLSKTELMDHDNDGIWRVDISSMKKKLLLSLSEIIDFEKKLEFSKSTHKVNHLQISPDGERFLFLHRYFFKNIRYDRLILGYSNSKKIILLSDSKIISHYCWLDNNSLAIYLNNKNYGESYYHFDINKNEWMRIRGLDKQGDGHPSGKNMKMITDNYPDRSGMQSLFLLNNLENEESVKLLGKFYHPLKFKGSSRCDLHPRYDVDRGVIYFDSAFNGKRQLYKINLN